MFLPTTHEASSRLPVGYGLLKAKGRHSPRGRMGGDDGGRDRRTLAMPIVFAYGFDPG